MNPTRGTQTPNLICSAKRGRAIFAALLAVLLLATARSSDYYSDSASDDMAKAGYRAPRDGLDIHIDGGPSPFDENNIIGRASIQAAVIDGP